MISIRRDVCDEIVRRFRSELEYYEAIARRFEEKYGCSLEELEKRIDREGVPLDNHELWEDSIEWRNAVEEIEKLRNLLEELR
jgi:translation initiation factor 2 alpha subunit (eIF-2alpha)